MRIALDASHSNVLLRLLNPDRRVARWFRKAIFLGVAVLFTFYPNPSLLVRHLRHWSDLPSMIEPDPVLLPFGSWMLNRTVAEIRWATSASPRGKSAAGADRCDVDVGIVAAGAPRGVGVFTANGS